MISLAGSSLRSLKSWAVFMALGAIAMEFAAFAQLGSSPFISHMQSYLGLGWSAYLLGWELGLPWLVLQIAGRVPQRLSRFMIALASLGAAAALLAQQSGEALPFEPSFHLLLSIIALPGIGCFCYAIGECWRARRARSVRPVANTESFVTWYGWLFVLLLAVQSFSLTGLVLSAGTWPLTWDTTVYRLDHVIFGGSPAGSAHLLMKAIPGLEATTRFVYASILFSAYVCIGAVLRKSGSREINLWAFVITPFWLPLLFYNWVPLSGPIYAFPTAFPSLPDPSLFASMVPTAIAPSPRNGMPSMHLSASIFLLVVSCIVRLRWLQLAATFMVLATAWATLALGEHYLLDLVVAIPGCAMIAFICLRMNRATSQTERVAAAIATIAFVVWMGLLRWSPSVLQLHWLSGALTLFGSLAAVVSMRLTVRAERF